jgi:hypothetical protein
MDDGNSSIAIIFCFGAYACAHTAVVYSDLTRNSPFMSFDGSICFLGMYHYESNAILATPISGLDDLNIFNAYKKSFNKLTSKGFKPKLNVMDNQATKFIKKFLTKEEYKLQLVEPHHHHVNAAKCTIQTFRDAFIAALATTDHDFPLQLWDKLMPQVQNTLIMMRASWIDPAVWAYKILNGPYDWSRYPLAPLECKALWASCGVDGWYQGPSHNHYQWDIYYIKFWDQPNCSRIIASSWT